MGLFDSIREKASELLSGAGDQVQEVASNLPGGQAVEDLTGSATDAAGQATDAAGQATENVTGAAQDLGADASGAVTDATGAVGDVTGAATENIEPYQP
jgi:hypothetical protein